jgi:hypothetical protein
MEDSSMATLHHNTMFFKGLWQLELVSMKFEPLIGAMPQQAAAVRAALNSYTSHSYVSGGASGTSRTKLAQQAKISNGSAATLPEFDWNCRLCTLAGPTHCHHQQHAAPGSTAATSHQGALREPLLSLLFVTLPSACPIPAGGPGASPATAAALGSAAGPLFPALSPVSPSLQPGSVPADSPLAWINLRDIALLKWLRGTGRGAQVLDVVDVDWSQGTVTAWVNRTYVHYVRKCSAHAQVCLIDFERLAVIAPPRSVVHLKTLRSVNIR